MTAQVADGELDMALGAFTYQPEGVRTAVLFDDDFACAVDAATVRDTGRLDHVAYLARSHVLVSAASERGELIDATVARLGGRRKIACTVPHWRVAPALIAGTNMVLTAARRTLAALEDPRLTIFEAPFSIPGFSYSMIWPERAEADPGHTWLRERVLQAAAAPESEAEAAISLRG